MAKIIKLTYRQLREAEVSDFTYLDTDNDKASCDGKSHISVDGKIDNDTVGDTTTNDKIASVLTPKSQNRFHSYGSLYGRNMREGVDINKDNVDDFYNNDEDVEKIILKDKGVKTYDIHYRRHTLFSRADL